MQHCELAKKYFYLFAYLAAEGATLLQL